MHKHFKIIFSDLSKMQNRKKSPSSVPLMEEGGTTVSWKLDSYFCRALTIFISFKLKENTPSDNTSGTTDIVHDVELGTDSDGSERICHESWSITVSPFPQPIFNGLHQEMTKKVLRKVKVLG